MQSRVKATDFWLAALAFGALLAAVTAQGNHFVFFLLLTGNGAVPSQNALSSAVSLVPPVLLPLNCSPISPQALVSFSLTLAP